MTPKIALNLSQDGIALLHRAEDGSGWYEEGRVDFEKDDIETGLKALQEQAAKLEGEGFETKLVLPHSQLLFATLDLGDDVGAALEERTPYRADQLSFDVNANGEKVQVVAVAMETLGEAEGFINKYGFNPVGFTAIPRAGQFEGEPMLGGTLMGPDRFETDKQAVKLLGSRPPKPKAKQKPKAPAPKPKPAEQSAAPSSAAFTSRRKTDDVDAPAADTKRLSAVPPRIAVPDTAPRLGAATASTRAAPKKPAKSAPTVPPAPPMREVPKPVLSSGAPLKPEATESTTEKADPIAELAAKDARGKPRFLGLILTMILLACLGLAALLSSYLLPPDSVSNWFGPNNDLYEELIAEELGETGPTTTGNGAATGALVEVDPSLDPSNALPLETESALSLPEELDIASLPIGQTLPEPTLDDPELRPEPEPVAEPIVEAIPVPPAPLTEDDVLAAYAATGIWQRMEPFAAQGEAISTLDNLYITSLAPELKLEDPPALFAPSDGGSILDLASVLRPPPPGVLFDLNAQGLVRPTPDGALSPQGHLVFLGQPPLQALPRPTEDAPEITAPEVASEGVDQEQLRLAALRPRARPSDLADQIERDQLGGNTISELAQIRPAQRPASAQAQAEAIARALAEAEAESTGTAVVNATELAVASSLRARQRPANFATLVARAMPAPQTQTQTASAAGIAAAPQRAAGPAVARASRVQPTGPVSRTVARAATETNAISLGRVSLIGVFGTSSNRRALVRMPNGRFVKVSVGDRVDGGRVAAIDGSSLRYVKGGRNLTLKMPQG
ncbi:MAG: hypothetical protein AAF340_09525 [Pseudomonadota bacterium]